MKLYVDDGNKKHQDAAEKSVKTTDIHMDTTGARLDPYGQSGFRSVGGEEIPVYPPRTKPQPPQHQSSQRQEQNQKQEWRSLALLGTIAAALVLVLCLTLGTGNTSAPKVDSGNSSTSNAGTSNKDSSNNSSANGGSSNNGSSNNGPLNNGISNGGFSNNGSNSGGNSISDTEWRNNVMSSSGLDAFKRDRSRILSVTFYNTLDYAPTNSDEIYYLGANASPRVQGWIEYEGKNVHLYVAADGGVNVKLCAEGFFEGCDKLEVISFNGAIHTEEVTSMRDMFNGCYSLVWANFADLDTSNVTDMHNMFKNCQSLTVMDVGSFDTSKVTDMSYMFAVCSELTELNILSFDTSNVTNMSYMFSGCNSIEAIHSALDTSKVTNMTSMFRYCHMLDSLPVGNWDVSRVTKWDHFLDDGITVNGRPWEELFA